MICLMHWHVDNMDLYDCTKTFGLTELGRVEEARVFARDFFVKLLYLLCRMVLIPTGWNKYTNTHSKCQTPITYSQTLWCSESARNINCNQNHICTGLSIVARSVSKICFEFGWMASNVIHVTWLLQPPRCPPSLPLPHPTSPDVSVYAHVSKGHTLDGQSGCWH